MKTKGVTLIETVMALGISAILMGITMLSMTMLGRQRLTSETLTLVSNLSWARESALSQHENFIVKLDLDQEQYGVYKDTNGNGHFNNSDELIKEQKLTVDLYSLQDLDGSTVHQEYITFFAHSGTADKDVVIELRHAGSVRKITVFSTTGLIREGGPGERRRRGRRRCFIATAAYGGRNSENHEESIKPQEIVVLEKFRDQCLLRYSFGKAAVELYYTVSPPIADYIEQREWARKTVRVLLRPVVWYAGFFVE